MEDFDPRTWTNIPTWRANLEMRFTENLEDFAGLELDDIMDALLNHALKAVESENPLAKDLAEAFLFEVDWQNIAQVILDKREKPSLTSDERVEPNAIIQNMLAKGMEVWACGSDDSYDDARDKIGRDAYRVTRYDADNYYPVWTWYAGWKYAIPINTTTMTEITEVPK